MTGWKKRIIADKQNEQTRGEKTMKEYLDQRLQELRKRYTETGESKWLYRYNECQHIREKLVIQEIDNTQPDTRYNPDE